MFWWRLALRLFVFVLMAKLLPSQKTGVPFCDYPAYRSALERAVDRNDPDNLDTLRALYALGVTEGEPSGPPEVPCAVWLLGDFSVIDADHGEGSVSLDGKGHYGFIDASGMEILKHRAELVAGLRPRTDAKGHRGTPNTFSMDYYGFDADDLTLARDRRLHPYEWFAAKVAYYGLPILLSLALMAGFFYVHGTGKNSQDKVRKAFIKAVDNDQTEFSAGGMKWLRLGDEYVLAHSLTGPDYETRSEREAWVRFALPVLAVVLPLWIPSRILPLQPVYPTSSLDSLVANVTRYQDQLIAVFALSLLVIAYEWVFRQGYQSIWGAMVFDPSPESLRQMSFREQQAHGAAGESSESETLRAAAGNSRRSSVHDQKF